MVFLNDQTKIYLDMIWRRKWWLVVPTILALIASQLALQRMPKVYEVSTTVLVVSQKVPADIARSTVASDIDDRMASLRVQILSQQYLENVVKKVGLVAEDASRAEIEMACRRLAGRVKINYDMQEYSWFRITLTDQDPRRAAEAANLLADLFIRQNTQFRTAEAQATLEQIQQWEHDKKKELDALDKQIAEYQHRYMFELPERLGTNLQLLAGKQGQLGVLSDEIQTLGLRMDAYKAQAQAQAQTEADPGAVVPGAALFTTPAQRELATLRKQLSDLRLKYTDQHPQVRLAREQIEELLRQYPELALGAESPTGGQEPAAAQSVTDPTLLQMQTEMEGLEKEKARLQEEIAKLQGWIDRAPIHEQQLNDLTRDYAALKADHGGLVAKRQEALRAVDLESKERGESFRVQDYAYAPSRPKSPDPVQIVLMFLIGGFGLGIGAALLLEVIDQSFKTEAEFRTTYPNIPLLVTVPTFRTTKRVRKGGRRGRARRGERSHR